MTTVSPFILPTGVNPDLRDMHRALLIVAHPDDIDYGAGGTVATLTRHGIDVAYCLVTSGDAGGDNDGLTRQARVDMREREQTDAANVLGVDRLHFLKQPDGCIEVSLDLREKLTRIIRREKPDLVITQSPTRRYDRIYASHPDHLAVGESTLCAVYPDAQNPHAFPHLLDEGLNPHNVKAVWVMSDEQVDTYIDITDVIDTKIEALMCHSSQISDRESTDKMVREWSALSARQGALEQGHFAEMFRCIQIMH